MSNLALSELSGSANLFQIRVSCCACYSPSFFFPNAVTFFKSLITTGITTNGQPATKATFSVSVSKDRRQRGQRGTKDRRKDGGEGQRGYQRRSCSVQEFHPALLAYGAMQDLQLTVCSASNERTRVALYPIRRSWADTQESGKGRVGVQYSPTNKGGKRRTVGEEI